MAASSLNFSSSTSLLASAPNQSHQFMFTKIHCHSPALKTFKNRVSFTVRAAKLPAGVEVPKVQPKFQAPFLGFTRTAEIWNSRACMIGLIGIFIVELILNKGILQVIGVDVGRGLDLPL